MTRFQKKFLTFLPYFAFFASLIINIYQLKHNKIIDNSFNFTEAEREKIRQNFLKEQDCEINNQHKIENL